MHSFYTDKIFEIKGEQDFSGLALEIFEFQYQNNKIYKAFCDSLRKPAGSVTHYTEIPFLPIEFFKSHEIVTGDRSPDAIIFTSSSTTSSVPSKHVVNDIGLYEKSFLKGFEHFYGKCNEYALLALLPGYLERKGSSLVYMFDYLIKESHTNLSGFFLNSSEELIQTITKLKNKNQKAILIGVTYALIDLADKTPDLYQNLIVMETGGMKGKRKEMVKEELHRYLMTKLKVNCIHSEYGMTELLSQAYSTGDGFFKCPPWMKILIRDMEDPFTLVKEGKTGGINVIDLANIYSCSFISTSDLGRISGDTFEVMGRFDNSDIRGCNLMVE